MPAKSDPATDRLTATILVVEDDTAVREAAVWVLKLMGYDTLEAENGPAALDVLGRNGTIQLMFSDVVMPKGMSGLELAEEARRRHPDLKILLTTGYSAIELNGASLTEGGIRVITKPYGNNDLDNTLQEILAE